VLIVEVAVKVEFIEVVHL